LLIKCNINLAKHADCGINPGLRSFFCLHIGLKAWGEIDWRRIYITRWITDGMTPRRNGLVFAAVNADVFQNVLERAVFVLPSNAGTYNLRIRMGEYQ
jgi:hypothetical protein